MGYAEHKQQSFHDAGHHGSAPLVHILPINEIDVVHD